MLKSKVLLLALFLLKFCFGFSYYSESEYNIENKSKPNIIFLLTDDQRWDALGAAGNPIIRTPHLDRLASEGILFRNAYATTSICCVSRASILTGQYEAFHKIHDFSTDFSPEVLSRTFPVILKNNGYMIGSVGKYGIGKNPPESLYDFWINTELVKGGQPDYIMTGTDGKPIHDTDTISNAVQVFLDKFSNKGKPFCLTVSFKAPHELDGNPPKYIIQERYRDYYKDVTIPEPVTADPEYWNLLPDFFRTETNFGRARWRGLFGTPELYQENVKNYYRLITGVDDVVGKIVDKLKKLSIEDNTVIIFMGDNGMFLGEHGIEGKWYGYEESIRVPLLLYYPGLPDKIRQYRAHQMVLNIDIAPTVLGLAGVKIPEEMQGIDLIRLLRKEIPEREDFFYQHYFLGGPRIPQVEGVVAKDLKYMNYIEHNYEELYDTRYDPHETTNLVNDSEYEMKLQVIRRRYEELKSIYGVKSQEK